MAVVVRLIAIFGAFTALYLPVSANAAYTAWLAGGGSSLVLVGAGEALDAFIDSCLIRVCAYGAWAALEECGCFLWVPLDVHWVADYQWGGAGRLLDNYWV